MPGSWTAAATSCAVSASMTMFWQSSTPQTTYSRWRQRWSWSGRRSSRFRGNDRYPTRPRSAAWRRARHSVGKQCRENHAAPLACLIGRVWMYHAGGGVPQRLMEGLTRASADGLPPLGGLLVDDPFWPYPARGLAREWAGHVRVWATAGACAGYLAVVTETGGVISVTESAGRIWAGLARRYGPSVVLLEHTRRSAQDRGGPAVPQRGGELVALGTDSEDALDDAVK